jgi:hypothetical protein
MEPRNGSCDDPLHNPDPPGHDDRDADRRRVHELLTSASWEHAARIFQDTLGEVAELRLDLSLCRQHRERLELRNARLITNGQEASRTYAALLTDRDDLRRSLDERANLRRRREETAALTATLGTLHDELTRTQGSLDACRETRLIAEQERDEARRQRDAKAGANELLTSAARADQRKMNELLGQLAKLSRENETLKRHADTLENASTRPAPVTRETVVETHGLVISRVPNDAYPIRAYCPTCGWSDGIFDSSAQRTVAEVMITFRTLHDQSPAGSVS